MVPSEQDMTEQLSADDWINQGLKALARNGFTALKADPLAKAMGVSRGSFYWHFADLGAFHAEVLQRWRDIAAEQIIADVEADHATDPLRSLLRRAFGARLDLERAVRNWAAFEPAAQVAIRAIDRRRLDYIEGLLGKRGLTPTLAQSRAQILYWTFLGFALSGMSTPAARLQGLLDELLQMVSDERR
jgi:AcrR family transcriptional regulator